jgi:hypothetical protein
MEFGREFFGRFGLRRGVQLVALALLWVATGKSTPDDVAQTRVMSRATAYRVLKDVREFNMQLAAKGLRVGSDLELLARVGDIGPEEVRPA